MNIPHVNIEEEQIPPNKDIDINDCIYALFKRIYHVKEANSCFSCSCYNFHRFGIPCRHIYHVLSNLPGYTNPSHHDVSIRYWKDFNYYVSMLNISIENNEIYKQMKTMFDCSYQLEPAGPLVEDRSLYDNIPIVEEIPDRFNIPSPFCLNYNIDYLSSNMDRLNRIDELPLGTSVSMSQDRETEDNDDIANQSQLQQSLENIILFEEYSCNANETDSNQIHKPKAWSLMEPFKELLNNLRNEPDISHYNRINNFITKEIAHLKSMHNDRANIPLAIGKNVSSNVPSCKRKKTHGTHYLSKV